MRCIYIKFHLWHFDVPTHEPRKSDPHSYPILHAGRPCWFAACKVQHHNCMAYPLKTYILCAVVAATDTSTPGPHPHAIRHASARGLVPTMVQRLVPEALSRLLALPLDFQLEMIWPPLTTGLSLELVGSFG